MLSKTASLNIWGNKSPYGDKNPQMMKMRFSEYLDKIFARGSNVKILRVLVSSPGKQWTERELASASGIDHKMVNHVMPLFVGYKLVDKRQVGRANVYQLNPNHYVIKQLRGLFEGEREARENLKKKLTQACALNKSIISVTMFGSVARGTEELDSDVDLLLVVSKQIEGTIFKEVEIEFGHVIVPHILTLDKLKKGKRSPLLHEVLRMGEHVYGKKLSEVLR